MSIVSEFISSGDFIKAGVFEKEQRVRFVKVERVQASDPKYGDEEGMTIKYTLEIDGVERVLTTNSKRLLTAVEEAGIGVGDHAIISREGTGFETTWSVSKLGMDAGEVEPF